MKTAGIVTSLLLTLILTACASTNDSKTVVANEPGQKAGVTGSMLPKNADNSFNVKTVTSLGQ